MKTELIVALIAGSLFWGIKALIIKEKTVNSKTRLEDGRDFVDHLEKLGYFKYADATDIKPLKETMIEAYDPTSLLETIWDDESGIPKDFRLYQCDGENLFEAGGFTSLLKELQPTFDKIGFSIAVTNHIEEWDEKNNWLNHSVTVNGNNYTIFKNFTEIGWGEAAQTFADIINAELTLQNKEERIYLINGANEGMLILLDEKQFNYIDTTYRNKEWKPLSVKEWCRVMKVKPQKI